MRITLTGRRLAVAAVLLLAGAMAPLAYSALGKSDSNTARPLASPVGAASIAAAQAPTAVADNPYQFILPMSQGSGTQCVNPIGLPPGVDFALESVAVFKSGGTGTGPSYARIFLRYKVDAQTSRLSEAGFEIPFDVNGNGTRAFNLVIRPDSLQNAAGGEIYELGVCIVGGSGTNEMNVAFTGQRIPTTPTANLVLDFRAHGGSRGTTLRWTTGSEAEIAGFNVWSYRNGKGVKVNRTLIRAKRSGEPAGASYRFVDPVARVRRGLTYRLQLVDLKGKRSWYAAFAIASK
jgi:hypothetical protein